MFLKQSNKEACPYFTFIFCPTFAPLLYHALKTPKSTSLKSSIFHIFDYFQYEKFLQIHAGASKPTGKSLDNVLTPKS